MWITETFDWQMVASQALPARPATPCGSQRPQRGHGVVARSARHSFCVAALGRSLAALTLTASAAVADYTNSVGMRFVDVGASSKAGFLMGSCGVGNYLFSHQTLGINAHRYSGNNKLLCQGVSAPDPQADQNELPQHAVRLSQPFQISRYETTVGEYMAFARQSGREDLLDDAFMRANGERQNAPVTMVSWDDAQAFIAWLNDQLVGKGARGRYRLPTEAEWEYAARAGSLTHYAFGNDPRDLADYAWYSLNANRPGDVGRKKPNALGLHDMHGNVWEWTQDWYAAYRKPSKKSGDDPSGPARGDARVVRGGSWRVGYRYARSAARSSADPGMRRDHVGFRVVRELR